MNIIQIQDRLKGLPNEALVNYVEQPMGEVPIYLALGELQRRKGMRERFQASQTPPPSVSEQVVAEAKPQQMGLGAIPPQPQPQMDPRQLAASGIAANPVSNVGQYAEGGIVGYGKGDLVKKYGTKLKEIIFGRKGKDAVKGKPDYTSDVGPLKEPGSYIGGSEAVPALKNIVARNKWMSAGLGTWGGMEAYDAIFGEDGSLDVEPTSKEDYDKQLAAINEDKKETGAAPAAPKVTEEQSLEKRFKELQNIIGLDKGREKIDVELAKKKKSSLNMAGIMAGLTMAGGKSANFLENLAAGAQAGVGSYTDTQADIFELEAELAKADRSERIAIIGQALEDGRIDKKMANELAIANIHGPTVAPMAKPAAKVTEDINKEIMLLQKTMADEIAAGNTKRADEIRTMILNRIKVKNQAIADSVSLSTDPSTYSAGTGQTTDDFLGIL